MSIIAGLYFSFVKFWSVQNRPSGEAVSLAPEIPQALYLCIFWCRKGLQIGLYNTDYDINSIPRGESQNW